MASQGIFANEAPDSGSIRVLYRTINNKDTVKALTISNVDLDGDDIAISLNELDVIALPLSGSQGTTQLQVRSIRQRQGYHFLDVSDTIVNSLSGSFNASIALSPYLTETFFYNDYNATISNAEISRQSFLRYDVDRSSGLVKPTNYNALAGVENATVGNMVYSFNQSVSEEISFSVSTTIGAVNSSTAIVKDDEDFTFRVGPQALNAAIGFPQKSVINVPEKFFLEGGNLKVSSSLNLVFNSNSDFSTSGPGVSGSIFLAEQLYDNATINARTFEPGKNGASLRIPSGSYGGLIHMRLEQKSVVNNVSTPNPIINVSSILENNINSDNFLNIDIIRDSDEDQIPFAELAPVQDSNYTSTGLVNARYRGSKTTAGDYTGIEPAITATSFEAALYPINDENNFICSQSLQDRDIEEFLFTGGGELPGVETQKIGDIDSGNTLTSTTDTVFWLESISQELIDSISVGDVLNLTSGSFSENVQVLTTAYQAQGIQYLLVARDYGGDGAGAQSSFGEGTRVARFTTTRIFKIEGNRLVGVTGKKVWVKDNRTILKTTTEGYVTELSTTCTV